MCCRSLMPPFLLIYIVDQAISKGTACYTCMALNYRTVVPSRNAPLPPPQDPRNLSELFHAMRLSGVQVPLLMDSCADLPPKSATSFMQASVTLCQHSPCAKLKFQYKGENVVARSCASDLFTTEALSHGLVSNCQSKSSEVSLGLLMNVSICECDRDLCNWSGRRLIGGFLSSMIFLILAIT
ncbi:hypothetical protein Q1695_011121 [Nippostrongylus brasiliensis]|nr:hypothetical protein Q1695_011121 [Nippostrongylus brasiliensis]